MKFKTLLGILSSAAAANVAIADSPITSGKIDMLVTPIGDTTAGVRYAVSENVAAYAVLDLFSTYRDSNTRYNSGSESQEDYSTERENEWDVQFGAQYFLNNGFHILGEVGYQRYTESLDYDDPSQTDEEYLWSGFDASVGAGFEQNVTDRFGVFLNAKLEIGARSSEFETTTNNTSTPGGETDRRFVQTLYSLGFKYQVN